MKYFLISNWNKFCKVVLTINSTTLEGLSSVKSVLLRRAQMKHQWRVLKTQKWRELWARKGILHVILILVITNYLIFFSLPKLNVTLIDPATQGVYMGLIHGHLLSGPQRTFKQHRYFVFYCFKGFEFLDNSVQVLSDILLSFILFKSWWSQSAYMKALTFNYRPRSIKEAETRLNYCKLCLIFLFPKWLCDCTITSFFSLLIASCLLI